MASEAFQQLLVRMRDVPQIPPLPNGELDFPAMRAAMESRAFRATEGTEARSVDCAGTPAEWVWWPGADLSRRLLWLHGGGYVMGSPVTRRELAGGLSRASGCVTLVLDYRLAPEHPFPAAVDDALSALSWVAANGPAGTSPANAIAIGGDSAGGGLALATLIAARDRGMPLPNATLTMSAWADMLCSGDSYTEFGSGNVTQMAQAYLQGADPRDPLASPVYGDLRGLPPLLLQVGDAEAFLDDSTQLAARARQAGVDVTLDVWPEMIHVFQSYAPLIPEGQQALDRAGSFLRERLGVPLVTTA